MLRSIARKRNSLWQGSLTGCSSSSDCFYHPSMTSYVTPSSNRTVSSLSRVTTSLPLSTFSLDSLHNSPSHCHSQRRWKGAFVSRHNVSLNLNHQVVQDYCKHHALQVKTTASHVMVKECPFCSKPTGEKLSNLYKLYIQSNTGAYFCHRCGAKGSWFDFKAALSGHGGASLSTRPGTGSGSWSLSGAGSIGGTSHGGNGGGYEGSSMIQGSRSPVAEPPLPLPPPRLSATYSTSLLDSASKDSIRALEYLEKERGLKRATLRKYGVGMGEYSFPTDRKYERAVCITFPWYVKESDVAKQEELRGAEYEGSQNKYSGKIVSPEAVPQVETPKPTDSFVTRRIKARALDQKAWQRLDPAGGGWGLFGLHTVPEDATEIVLTEGEYDAMAVSQATGRPAVSLPNGCRSLPVPVLPLLERFEKIYLWMDNDLPGKEGAEQFSKKLGLNRCFVVNCPDAKDANEALLKNLDLEKYIQRASVIPHDRLLSFRDLREAVLHELLEPDMYTGVGLPSLPIFTDLIKGFRRGEMTVLTGPTGSGKTTFLGQVSLDLAEQGINVLWGSFEVKNTRLLHKLLKQYSRKALPDPKDEDARIKLEALADKFETLPMQFLKFHGGSDIDEVLDAMEYAVYVHDTEHIILDNMQFMITRGNATGGAFEKFDIQDIAIEKFRKFATNHNVHLTLVVHPRKEDEAAKLNISSFYGSAKATQEADTVLILQHDGRKKYVEVKKNRFDGTLGCSPLYFQSKSGRYVETEGGEPSAPQNNGETRPGNQGSHYGANRKRDGGYGSQPHSVSPPLPNLEKHWTGMGLAS